MKITTKQLKRLIQEELRSVLEESWWNPFGPGSSTESPKSAALGSIVGGQEELPPLKGTQETEEEVCPEEDLEKLAERLREALNGEPESWDEDTIDPLMMLVDSCGLDKNWWSRMKLPYQYLFWKEDDASKFQLQNWKKEEEDSQNRRADMPNPYHWDDKEWWDDD